MKGSINFFDEFFRDSLGCTFAELFPNTDSESCSHYYSESSVMDSTGHVETVVNDNGKVKRYSGYAPSFDSAVQLSREALAQGKLPNRLPAAYMRGTILPHTDGFILKDGSLKIECSLLKVSEDRISVDYDNAFELVSSTEDADAGSSAIITIDGINDPSFWDSPEDIYTNSGEYKSGYLNLNLTNGNKVNVDMSSIDKWYEGD